MRRKIIKQGLGGHTIFLPIQWIREQNLKPGDEINIKHVDQDIIISGRENPELKTKIVTLQEKTSLRHIRSVIASAYKAGYDEILINYNHPPSIYEINRIVNTFTGLEVLSHTDKQLKIKSFLQVSETETEQLIIKMFQLIKVVFEQLYNSWEKIPLEEIYELVEVTIRKIRDHCLKNIHSTKYKGDKSYDYYDLVTILEKIAAELYYLASYLTENTPTQTKITRRMITLLDDLYRCFLKKDFATANKLWLDVRKESKALFGEKIINRVGKKEDIGVFSHYYHLMLLYRHLSSRLLSLAD